MFRIAFASLLLWSSMAAQATEPTKDAPVKKLPAKEAPTKDVPGKAIKFTGAPVPDQPPLDVDEATTAAIKALLALPEGEEHDQWPYEGVYREDRGNLPIGYRVGGTAIVGLSLIAAPGFRGDQARQDALARGVAFILKTLEVPRMQIAFEGTYDVRGWGHIYALQLFLELQDHQLAPAAHAAAIGDKTRWLVQALCDSAIPEAGGWNYSRTKGYLSPQNRASTFMTPPALQALFHAQARGYAVPDQVLDQALQALERARSESGGYAYGAPAESQNEVPADKLKFMDQVPSSAARATACEATLMLAGRGDPERLHRAVLRFFEHWDALAVRKSQPKTHEPPYGIAPYYFLYGHLYAAQAIELLADAKEKDALRLKMRAYLARSRDPDGSWNDRQFDRSAGYGTALAILCLQMPKLHAPVARPAPVKKD
ncbi:MAG TPA: hypothetical protein VK348_08720 [Planctomycetota bacterium]|nr:hypothetical protein [Planctomycetota bacterium]